MPGINPILFSGRADTLLIRQYKFGEKFGERSEQLVAWSRSVFDSEGRVSDIDYRPDTFVGYFMPRRAYIVTDGNLHDDTVEYDSDGRVTRRYPYYGGGSLHIDYFYDSQGRVERVVVDSGRGSGSADHIVTFRYTYMTREDMTDYISTIEHFKGTERKHKIEYRYAANGRLSVVGMEDKDAPLPERRRLTYSWDDNGTLLAYDDVFEDLSDGTQIRETDYKFSWAWGNGVPVSRSLELSQVYKSRYNQPKKSSAMYYFVYDERGNWTEFSWQYGKYVRDISYSSEPGSSDGIVCLACGKHMGVHTAFCPECGEQQVPIAAAQREQAERERQEQEAQPATEFPQQADDMGQDNSDDATADDAAVTGTEENGSSFLLWAVLVIALAAVAAWFVRRRRQ